MRSYLVTGGAGFIGSHLVDKIVSVGARAIVLDDFSTGSRGNLSQFAINTVEVVEGDIRDAQLLDQLAQKVDGIFHLAALVSVPLSIEKPEVSFDINARGTQLILDAARKAGGKKVVMASSAAVYGDSRLLPLSEHIEVVPLSPYGLDKLVGEKIGAMYASLYSMNTVSLRFFNVFGPRQNPSSPYSGVISILIDKHLRAESPVIYGDGKQTRDFIFVEDVAHALLASMLSSLCGFRLYNVACGKATSINMIWETICRNSQSDIEANYTEGRLGDIKHSVANISKLVDELGYIPEVDVKDGLLRTYEWAASNTFR